MSVITPSQRRRESKDVKPWSSLMIFFFCTLFLANLKLMLRTGIKPQITHIFYLGDDMAHIEK